MSSYERVMLKLSGEMLGGDQGFGLSPEALALITGEIAALHKAGKEVAVVIGGGNFFRGSSAEDLGMERVSVDYMGILGTCINGLALQGVLEQHHKVPCRVMTAVSMPGLAEPYIRRRALKHLSLKRVVIFAAGVGSPMFTTDTAAALRGSEMNCHILLKATKVDGIYDRDPKNDPTAHRYERLSYLEVLAKKLQVMDATAISMCMEAHLPLLVFRLGRPGCVLEALSNPGIGTLVLGDKDVI